MSLDDRNQVPESAVRGTLLFVGASLTAAISVAGVLVSGWRGGSLDNRIEWAFWSGAIITAAAIAAFAVAAGSRSERFVVIRAGIAMFVFGPALSVAAVFIDYWI